MTDADPRPDRPASARPVRVVRFDDLGESDTSPVPGGAEGSAVAGLEALGGDGERPVRVAAFGDLDEPVAPSSRMASLDGLAGIGVADGRRAGGEEARATPGRTYDGPDRRPGGAQPAGAAGQPAGDSGAREAHADGVTPDGPLPRGRRRGARVGRLGPDALPGDPAESDGPQPEADPVAMAREICLRLLTDRARTRQELAQALARKGVPAEATATVLDRFDEVGLIDDAAFAEQWVRSRHAHRGLGRRAIAVELRRKGVADDVAGEALAEVDAESEGRRARELVDRKLRSLTVDTAEQRTVAARRLVGMLARKGYGAGTAYRVVREALAESGADADELGVDPPD